MRMTAKRLWCLMLLLLLAGCDIFPSAPVVEADASLEVAFTQSATGSTGMDLRLAQAIDNATSTVDVAAYDLDVRAVTDALVRAHQRGVTVRLVIEGDAQGALGHGNCRKSARRW